MRPDTRNRSLVAPMTREPDSPPMSSTLVWANRLAQFWPGESQPYTNACTAVHVCGIVLICWVAMVSVKALVPQRFRPTHQISFVIRRLWVRFPWAAPTKGQAVRGGQAYWLPFVFSACGIWSFLCLVSLHLLRGSLPASMAKPPSTFLNH